MICHQSLLFYREQKGISLAGELPIKIMSYLLFPKIPIQSHANIDLILYCEKLSSITLFENVRKGDVSLKRIQLKIRKRWCRA